MLAFILLLSPALAHIPHATVTALAIPRQDPTEPWFLALEAEVPTAVYRSTTEGATWEAVACDAVVDDLLDGATTDDGFAAFLSGSRYWWTTDGTTWSDVATVARPAGVLSPFAGGDRLYFATTTGVWAAVPGETPILDLPDVSIASVHEGEDGPVAVAAGGEVYARLDGAWVDAGGVPSGDAVSGTSGGGVVYAGTAAGEVYRWDGLGWVPCAALPLGSVGDPHATVTHLDARGGLLAVTRADVGVAISTDTCDTWAESPVPNHNDFAEDGGGSSTTDEAAFVGLARSGTNLFLAGYDGAAQSPDLGETWHVAPTVGADYAQAVAFAPDFDTSGLVFLGSYGAAITRVGEGGAWMAGPGPGGLMASNGQGIALPPDAVGGVPAYAVVERRLYSSADGGVTWALVGGPFSALQTVVARGGGRVYAVSVTSTTGAVPGMVLRSEDAGASWGDFPTLPEPIASEAVAEVAEGPGLLCFEGQYDVACSTDDGATWAIVYTTGGDRLTGLALWPPDAPTAVLVADHAGFWRVVDGTATLLRDFRLDPAFERLVVADDGRVYAADILGKLLESADGGLTWRDTGLRAPSQVASLAARPGFAAHPDLLVGTVDGAFLAHDGVLERFAPYQQVEDNSHFFRCEGCEAVADEAAVLSGYAAMDAADRLELSVRGESVRIVGASPSGAVLRIALDGVDVGEGKLAPTTDLGGTLWEATGLSWGWHLVEVEVGVGELAVDAVVGEAPGAVLDGVWSDPGDTAGETGETAGETGETGGETATDTGETGGDTGEPAGDKDEPDPATDTCGCGGGAGPPGIAGILLAAGLLRRRRP